MNETKTHGGTPARHHLWHGLLLAGGLWLAWQAVSGNMADHHLQRAGEGERQAVEAALWWQPDHPRALTLHARALQREGDARAAEDALRRAVTANPADARPLAELARLRAAAGSEALADEMMDAAHRLMPVHPGVQQNIGLYWLQRGEPARGIAHVATALSGDYRLKDRFFPLLLAAAEDPELRGALQPLAADPPTWWTSFVEQASRTAKSADSVIALLQMRAAAKDVPVSEREREALLQRLYRDGRVADAYLQWMNSLDETGLQRLGYVFDGGFEGPFANGGFGWFGNLPRNAGFRISTGATWGVSGERAVHIGFSGKRARFQHLYQNLFLGPGRYEVSGQFRPDALRARRGLQWRVHCNAGGSQLLGESEFLLEGTEWRRFSFDVEVPANCAGQVLRLYSGGNRDVDHELQGGAWFDAMRIARKPEARPIWGINGDTVRSSHASLASDRPAG